MSTRSFTSNLIINCLRAALVLALVGAGWAIYRTLPPGASIATNGAGSRTTLVIFLRRPFDESAETPLSVPVELYPVDVAAMRREFFDPDNRRAERRTGMRFDDFLARRMAGRPPVATRFDEHGQTMVTIAPGKWWVHATLTGAQNLEWRVPVNVSGREQSIELTPANAYARTESF
ncbi:MAG: hypothetical protein ABR577_03250 [Pyrinomonadaceae bacterium]